MAVAEPARADDHLGHRERLRQRLLDGNGEGLQDYELIECLLTLAIPRIDTKPLAKALMREFGSAGSVLAAKPDALMRVKGIGERAAAALRVAQVTATVLLREQAFERPVLASWQALLDYLRVDMSALDIERVRILHLNSKNMLIRDQLMGEGSLDQAAIYVREVIKHAINLGSASLIIVHNHPSGDPQPSRADIQLTRDIIDAGRRVGVAVHDHVIVSANGHASMRGLGLI